MLWTLLRCEITFPEIFQLFFLNGEPWLLSDFWAFSRQRNILSYTFLGQKKEEILDGLN